MIGACAAPSVDSNHLPPRLSELSGLPKIRGIERARLLCDLRSTRTDRGKRRRHSHGTIAWAFRDFLDPTD